MRLPDRLRNNYKYSSSSTLSSARSHSELILKLWSLQTVSESYSFTHLTTVLFTHLPNRWLTHPFIRSHSLLQSTTYLLPHSLTRSLTRHPIRTLTHSDTHPSAQLLTHSFTDCKFHMLSPFKMKLRYFGKGVDVLKNKKYKWFHGSYNKHYKLSA
jgi:hypothetical protein